MQSPAEATNATLVLLTIRGASGAWAIPSSAVASIEPPESAELTSPVDLLALLGAAPPAPGAERGRVLIVQADGQRLPVLVHGALHLAETAGSDLLQLPTALQPSAPLISHLAVSDGKPDLFVLSPERLLKAARGAFPAPQHHDSVSR
jgi:hypothetical protein